MMSDHEVGVCICISCGEERERLIKPGMLARIVSSLAPSEMYVLDSNREVGHVPERFNLNVNDLILVISCDERWTDFYVLGCPHRLWTTLTETLVEVKHG